MKIKELFILMKVVLYADLMRSRSKIAKEFQKWLVEDVLPHIRKHIY